MLDNIRDNLSLEELMEISENIAGRAPDDLKESSVLLWQKCAIVAVEFKEVIAGRNLLRKIKNLSNDFSELSGKYAQIAVWLCYSAFQSLDAPDIEIFFNNFDFTLVLRDGFYNDLDEKVKARLLFVPIEDRDKWREKIYNAMHENQNILTKNFMIQGSRPTIGNWLKEYDKKIGTKMAESITRANFETESSITAHLSAEEKILLKKFLDFYEFIKISSYDPAGFEEDVVIESEGKTYMNVNGEVIEVGDSNEQGIAASSSFAPSTELQRTPPSTAVGRRNDNQIPPQSAISQEAKKILSQTGGEISAVLNQLQNSIESGVALGSCAALLLLAQLRLLDNVLEDERFVHIIMEDLKRNAPEGSEQGVRINPTAPMYIARFLKVVLEDKLNLEHEGAIAFGRKLSQILEIESEKYMNIIKDGKWNI